MFDVFRSRDKAVRYFLIFLLGLIALSMLVYLIPQTGGDISTGANPVVAQIGSEKVTANDITQTIRQMEQNRQLPAALLSIYAPQVIQQLINERTMAWKANQMGMKVTSDEADNAIIDSIPAQYVKDGKVDPAILTSVLQQNNTTLADMKASKQREMLISRLEELVSGGVVVTGQEVEKEYHQRNDKVKIQFAVVSGADYRKDSEPTEAEIQSWYDSNKQSFQVPDKRSAAVVVLDPAKIGAGIQVTDAQLHSAYNNQQSDFTTPERVQARHILLKSDASNDAAVKAKAEALLKQLQGGADFGKLAKEKSEDQGSAVNNGELGWLVKGQTVKPFEDSAFSLKPGQMSGLVKTEYGYHIIQVEAHEQAHVKSFDEVKAQLTTDLQKQAAANQMQNLADKAVAGLRADPEHPEKTADAVGGTLIQVPDIEASEPIPGIGVSKELFDAVSALKKDEVTLGPVVLADGRALIAVVTNLVPAHQGTLDEVKTEVKDKAQQTKLQKIVAAKAAELVSKTQAMGGDLEKAAKSMSITVKTSGDVSRQDAIESVGTASSVPDLFTKPVGTILGPDSISSGQLVAKILSITPADAAGLVLQRTKILDDLKQQKIRDRVTFFQQGLRESLVASGKLKINQDVIDQILASYRQRS